MGLGQHWSVEFRERNMGHFKALISSEVSDKLTNEQMYTAEI